MTTEVQEAGAVTTEPGGQQSADANQAAATGTVDTKPAEQQTAADTDYAFAAPEGIELDKARVDEFVAIAKELKLPKDAAQKLVDLDVKRAQAAAEKHAEMIGGWAEQVKADKELGGDKLPETLATASKALDLGPPELRELLNTTGLGNHPAVVKWAHAVGKALSEDRFVPGSTKPNTDAARSFYDNSNMN